MNKKEFFYAGLKALLTGFLGNSRKLFKYRNKLRIRKQFKSERFLENGINISTGTRQSILLFTVHRCASTFTHKIIMELIRDLGYVQINFDKYFSATSLEKYLLYSQRDFLLKSFISVGYLYGPFRSFRDIPNMNNYKTILILRDPRDVLVSFYYSMLYSHKIINNRITELREEASKYSLDEYVILKAMEFKMIYEMYGQELFHKENCIILRYEDMIYDFKGWLNCLAEGLNLTISDNVLNNFLSTANFKTSNENVRSHIRQIASEDYKRKLNNSTINSLNEIFRAELNLLSYKIG